MKKLPLSILAASIAALSAPSYSATLTAQGFASINVGTTLDSNDVYEVTTNDDGEEIAYDDGANFQPGTRAAVQLTADLDNGLKFITQFISKGLNNYKTETEWMYLSYQINDTMRINAGRIVLPLYYYSDYRNVGYAYHWLRTPSNVYSEGFSNFEGVSYIYNSYIGELESNLQITSNLSDFHGISWTGTYNWLTVHGAIYSAKLANPAIDPALEAQEAFLEAASDATSAATSAGTIAATAGAAAAAAGAAAVAAGNAATAAGAAAAAATDPTLAAYLGAEASAQGAIAAAQGALAAAQGALATEQGDLAGKKTFEALMTTEAANLTGNYIDKGKSGEDIVFANFAVKGDFGDFFVLAEAVAVTFDPGYLYGDIDSFYLTAGYIFNEFTFHATFGQTDQDMGEDARDFLNDLNNTTVSASLGGSVYTQPLASDIADPLKQFINAGTTTTEEFTAGVRYNINANTAFKFEIINHDDILYDENDSTLYVTGIDLVF